MAGGILLLGQMLLLGGCDEEILHSLDENQANRVKLVLAQTGIVAEKIQENGSWALRVSGAEVTPALAALSRSRTLQRELTRKSELPAGLLQSKEERSRFAERELAWNLERTIESLPGVLEARVHLFLVAPSMLEVQEHAAEQSASALLILETGVKVEEQKIREIISGASGIQPQRVTVLSAAAEQNQWPAIGTPQLAASVKKTKGPAADVNGAYYSALGGLALLPMVGVILIVRRRNRSAELPPEMSEVGNACEGQNKETDSDTVQIVSETDRLLLKQSSVPINDQVF